MQHQFYKCPQNCDDEHCRYCRGGLLSCTVCGQAEGELTSDCHGAEPEESAESLRIYETGKAVAKQQEKAKWVTAFTAYQKALSEPYFDQDDESRQSNRQEVERCFDRLKQLAEER